MASRPACATDRLAPERAEGLCRKRRISFTAAAGSGTGSSRRPSFAPRVRVSSWAFRSVTARDATPAASRVAGCDQPRLVGVDDRLHAVAQAELAEQVGDMALDGCLGDDEHFGDLAVRQSSGEHAQDLALALGQLREALGRLRYRGRKAAPDLVE